MRKFGQKGFTLIELLVAVGAIGAVAVVGVVIVHFVAKFW